MRDAVYGVMLIALSVIIMVIYFWALFLSPTDARFWRYSISDWAIVIPVLLFVYLFLFVIAWIGWAMATTPPTLPVPEEQGEDRWKESEQHS
jgi:predicted DNA-binding transcriptional regulator